jgi:phage antirepressor YoqD-like protein
LKPIKLGCVKDVYQIGESRLRKMLLKRKVTIKIKNGVDPAMTARIFRVLGSRIDELRWKINAS